MPTESADAKQDGVTFEYGVRCVGLNGLGATDDVIIGRTGDVYEATTGEWLGTLTDKGLRG